MRAGRRIGGSADTVGILMYLAAAFLFAFNGSIAKLAMAAGLDSVRLTELRNAGVMGATITPDLIREALIKADEETWVVPKEVAAALDGMAR